MEKIATWIRDAATADSWQPGHHLRPPSGAMMLDLHHGPIQTALQRARRKTFVKIAKPFRRFFRNQGAVNDSILEALHHLALQNEELIEEIGQLRDDLRQLRRRSGSAPKVENEAEPECES